MVAIPIAFQLLYDDGEYALAMITPDSPEYSFEVVVSGLIRPFDLYIPNAMFLGSSTWIDIPGTGFPCLFPETSIGANILHEAATPSDIVCMYYGMIVG